jgi:ABC-type lipopolysaccharide export system ATPase subunit
MIHSDALFVLIDEPFNGVAPVYKEEIKKMIREQSGTKGFIITDHDYRNILDISTKTLLIQDGGIREVKDFEALQNLGYIPGG